LPAETVEEELAEEEEEEEEEKEDACVWDGLSRFGYGTVG